MIHSNGKPAMHKTLPTIVMLILIFAPGAKSQISYQDDIHPIFDEKCMGCHRGDSGDSGVNLSSYESVMSSVGEKYNKNIVIPGEPDESPIVDQIEPDPSYGFRMPLSGPPYLSNDEINRIRQWIAEGALEEPATPVTHESGIPGHFELLGNYPNPFNPETNIRFQLPRPANWSVTIYTTSGQFVSEESGWSQPGEVSVPVNIESRSSGLYIYVVEMWDNESTRARLSRNMLFIK